MATATRLELCCFAQTCVYTARTRVTDPRSQHVLRRPGWRRQVYGVHNVIGGGVERFLTQAVFDRGGTPWRAVVRYVAGRPPGRRGRRAPRRQRQMPRFACAPCGCGEFRCHLEKYIELRRHCALRPWPGRVGPRRICYCAGFRGPVARGRCSTTV